MSRFDNRTKEQFKKDIYFGTKVEQLVFDLFLISCEGKNIEIGNHKDNGVCNDGSFIESGNTSGADYLLEDFVYRGKRYDRLPLEVKWVPTYGKFTLKQGDLKAYKRESAAILFVYTSKKMELKKPKDLDFEKHRAKMLSAHSYLRWGIMLPERVSEILSLGNFKPIRYMGNKPGIVIPQGDFSSYFTEERM